MQSTSEKVVDDEERTSGNPGRKRGATCRNHPNGTHTISRHTKEGKVIQLNYKGTCNRVTCSNHPNGTYTIQKQTFKGKVTKMNYDGTCRNRIYNSFSKRLYLKNNN